MDKLGRFTPKRVERETLATGEVGFVIAGIKEIDGAPVGDTITLESRPCDGAAAGLQDSAAARVRRSVPGRTPTTTRRSATHCPKLRLNDSALHYEPEVSTALGFGFRCGFLGLLHMDIVQERLEREYELDLVTSAPTVIYEVRRRRTARLRRCRQSRQAAAGRPDQELREPIIIANILVPPGICRPVS